MSNGDLFGPQRESDITLDQKIEEIEREIKVRRRVYPRWVARGTLDGPLADYRIKVLRAILRDLEEARRQSK